MPSHQRIIAAVDDADPDIRLGVLLALKKSGDKEVEYVTEQFLADTDPRIRNMALIWAGSSQLTERRKDLEKALTSGETSTILFETYLETVKLLKPELWIPIKTGMNPIRNPLPEDFISSIVSDPAKPAKMRIFALRYLDDPAKHKDLLLSFLKKENDPEIRVNEVNQFMEENKSNPFYIYWALNISHYPLQGQGKWRDYYKNLASPRKEYAALISTMDEKIGMVLQKLG